MVDLNRDKLMESNKEEAIDKLLLVINSLSERLSEYEKTSAILHDSPNQSSFPHWDVWNRKVREEGL